MTTKPEWSLKYSRPSNLKTMFVYTLFPSEYVSVNLG